MNVCMNVGGRYLAFSGPVGEGTPVERASGEAPEASSISWLSSGSVIDWMIEWLKMEWSKMIEWLTMDWLKMVENGGKWLKVLKM